MSNGVNQCAACGDLWDDDEPHVACRSDHGHDPTDEAVAWAVPEAEHLLVKEA